jgi:hypothetical protein
VPQQEVWATAAAAFPAMPAVVDFARIGPSHGPDKIRKSARVLCGLRSRRFSVRGACVGTALTRALFRVSVMTDDDTMAIPEAAFFLRNSYDVESFLDADTPPEGAAPVERARRQRKPSVDKLIAKAKAAGATRVVIEGVEMHFGEPGAVTSSNPRDALPRFVM